MSNYCACSGGDEEYTIELNQQGPEGPQGEVGPEGFSPSISVKTSTENTYILTVVNKEGNFDTPNLYGETPKLNADLSNIPNPAFINGVSLSNSEENISSIDFNGSKIATDVDGNLILTASAADEEGTETFTYEIVANPKEQRLELHDNEGNVKIVATTDYIPTIDVATTTTAGIVKPDGSTITVTPDGTISAVTPDLSNYATKEELASTDATVTNLQTSVASNTTSIGTLREDLTNLETTVGNNSADIAALDADKLASSNIIAGANITIDRSGNNLTISSTGGGSGGSSIDDGSITTVSTWSSSKINSEITTAVDTIDSTKNDNIFDIGKYIVIGSPTISDDGIASGFSAKDYIKTGLPSKTVVNTEINILFKMGSLDDVQILCAASGSYRFQISYDNGNMMLFFGDIKTWPISISGWLSPSPNTEYLVKIVTSASEIKIYVNGTLTKTVPQTNFSYDLSYISVIGSRTYATILPFHGSIDLKQFSITVDGVEVFNGLMESTKPIYDKLTSTSTALSTFETDTDNNFSAVNSALNEKANLSDLAGYVTITKYNELLARVVALETEINGGNA